MNEYHSIALILAQYYQVKDNFNVLTNCWSDIHDYWNEIDESVRNDMRSATDASAAAEGILYDLRPGAFICWRDWNDGKRKYCKKGQTTWDLAVKEKMKTQNKRAKKSMIANAKKKQKFKVR